MIEFRCSACGRAYSVPDAAAGKQAKCKCGAAIAVPAARTAAPVEAAFSTPPQVGEMPTPLPPAPGVADFQPSAAQPIQRSADQPIPAPAVADQPTDTGSVKVSPVRPAAPPLSIPAGPPASLVAGKLPMRTRRLMADAAAMGKAFGTFELIKLKSTIGAPPEVYQIEFFVRGLERGKKRDPVTREHHVVEIQLTSDYPRVGPKCRMLTPVFHPNIDTSTICVGDHWTAGERLADLVVRIGEMLAYQDYNIKSPLDAEAAMWADLNRDKLPIDTRNVHPPLLEG